MAVAAYTNDLNLLSDFEGTIPSLGEFTNYTAGRGQAASTDYPIQGSTHIDVVANSIGQASVSVDNGSNITWTSGWVFFSWLVWTAPGAIATQANGGLVFIVGASVSNYRGWNVGGNDFGSYPYGGWQNFAVDPEITAFETVGSPGTNYRYVGVGVDVTPTAVAKGSPLGIDVIRYGRGTLRIVGGTSTDDDASFVGMAAANDANTARWGLFQKVEGGYKWKGVMYFGYGNPVEFTDLNKNIVIDNTQFVQSTFNRIEIHNASSVINWTNISITALGTISKGDLEMIDNATVNDLGGVFTDMNTFIYQSNATMTGRTYRRCGEITQGGATFDSCVFEESSAAVCLVVDDPDVITDCKFISDGTGHAIELTSACAGNSYTLSGLVVSGYASSDGSTGNEVIYNNSGGTVTINVDGGSGVSALSVRGGNVSLVANFSFVITGLELNTEVTIVTSGTSTVLYNVENATTSDGDGKYKITYSHSGGATVDILIHHIDYKPDISNIISLTLPSTNSSAKVKMFADENYENP